MESNQDKTRDGIPGKGTQSYGTGATREDQETGGKGTQSYGAGATRNDQETGGKGTLSYPAEGQ